MVVALDLVAHSMVPDYLLITGPSIGSLNATGSRGLSSARWLVGCECLSHVWDGSRWRGRFSPPPMPMGLPSMPEVRGAGPQRPGLHKGVQLLQLRRSVPPAVPAPPWVPFGAARAGGTPEQGVLKGADLPAVPRRQVRKGRPRLLRFFLFDEILLVTPMNETVAEG